MDSITAGTVVAALALGVGFCVRTLAVVAIAIAWWDISAVSDRSVECF